MDFPRLKEFRAKLSSARLLGTVFKNSIQFKIRRSALRRYKTKEFDTIIVDMDGTVYDSDSSLVGLKLFYPEGRVIYEEILEKIASGKFSVEEAIIEGNELLKQKKVNKKDFVKVLDAIKPTIRRPLIKALKRIKKNGKTVGLATLSSKTFGLLLNKHLEEKYGFKFDFVVGTELSFDSQGNINGVKEIVGMKDDEINGIFVKSKLTKVKEEMQKLGKEFSVRNSLLITDSYSDIDLAKMLVTILIKPKKPNKAQQISAKLRLSDYILPDSSELQLNLESIILGSGK